MTPISATSGEVAILAKAAAEGYSTSANTSHISSTSPMTSCWTGELKMNLPPFFSTTFCIAVP